MASSKRRRDDVKKRRHSANPPLHLYPTSMVMGPLQLAVTWYKIHHAGEQSPHWDIQNKETANLS